MILWKEFSQILVMKEFPMDIGNTHFSDIISYPNSANFGGEEVDLLDSGILTTGNLGDIRISF